MSQGRHPRVASDGATTAEAPIKVVIGEDNPRMRSSLRTLLEATPGVTVAGEAGDLALTRQHVLGHRPDVLVLDLRMPEGLSVPMIGELRRRVPQTHVVVVSMEDAAGFAQCSLAAGASGYVLKDSAAEDLPAAVRAAAGDEQYVSEPIAARLAVPSRADRWGALEPRDRSAVVIASGQT
jgi:DNA-binding NarL/FixJ family response regulator